MARRLRRIPAIRTWRSRPLPRLAQSIRVSSDASSKKLRPDFPIEPVWSNWLKHSSVANRRVDSRSLYRRSRQARIDETRIAAGRSKSGLKAHALTDRGGRRGAQRLVSSGARAFLSDYDYFITPPAQVFPFDATIHWPKEHRRQIDGYLPSMDGSRGRGDDVGLSGARRARRLQRTRIADGYSDCSPESRRDELYATSICLRSGDSVGNEAIAANTQ